MKKWIIILPVIFCGACYDPHAQQSKIVQEVQKSGAGNLSITSPQGLSFYFSQHQELARKIAGECERIAPAANAHWAETSEGMICLTARSQVHVEWHGDHRAF